MCSHSGRPWRRCQVALSAPSETGPPSLQSVSLLYHSHQMSQALTPQHLPSTDEAADAGSPSSQHSAACSLVLSPVLRNERQKRALHVPCPAGSPWNLHRISPHQSCSFVRKKVQGPAGPSFSVTVFAYSLNKDLDCVAPRKVRAPSNSFPSCPWRGQRQPVGRLLLSAQRHLEGTNPH